MTSTTYHDGMRRLQDRFDTCRLADRLDEHLGRASPRKIVRSSMPHLFFCQRRRARCTGLLVQGGAAGFVRVTGESELAFQLRRQRHVPQPGQHPGHPAVGLLFIDFEQPRRLRVNGRASDRRRRSATGPVRRRS